MSSAGRFRRDATTGRCKRNSSTGRFKRSTSATGSGCCCAQCSDYVGNTYTISFVCSGTINGTPFAGVAVNLTGTITATGGGGQAGFVIPITAAGVPADFNGGAAFTICFQCSASDGSLGWIISLDCFCSGMAPEYNPCFSVGLTQTTEPPFPGPTGTNYTYVTNNPGGPPVASFAQGCANIEHNPCGFSPPAPSSDIITITTPITVA